MPPFQELHSHLAALESQVPRNEDDFGAYVLSAGYLEYAYWRDSVVQDAKKATSASSTGALIRNIAERDRTMVQKLDAEWNRGRFDDSAAKLGPVTDMRPPDQLLFNMRQAAQFSAQLAARNDQFLRLLG